MHEDEFSELVANVFPDLRGGITPEEFRERYRKQICNSESWPKAFPIADDGSVQEGIEVRSISGKIEGRTTGSQRKCAADGCKGWFIGVLWETGQQMYLCSEGWHFSSDGGEGRPRIDIIGGGEISARFVSPKPLGVSPLDKKEWPKRQDLMKRKGWRKSQQ